MNPIKDETRISAGSHSASLVGEVICMPNDIRKSKPTKYKKYMDELSPADFSDHISSLTDAERIQAVSVLELRKRKLDKEKVQILLDCYEEVEILFAGYDYEKRLSEALGMGKDMFFVYYKLFSALYTNRYALRANKDGSPDKRRVTTIVGVSVKEWESVQEDITRYFSVYKGYCYLPWLSMELLVAKSTHYSASVRGTAGGLRSGEVRAES